jgi:hypothetical protein
MKDFISYEEALELKQLGFKERCLGHYWENLFYFRTTFNHPSTMPNSPESCLAPTYSQAFRWFREKHNLFGQVNIHTYFIYNISNGDFKMVKKYDKLFETYEEAELECLKKLIEIVKGGNK